MGTKNNPAPFDCYAKALPDEPMFVLLARDGAAPSLVEHWAVTRETRTLGAGGTETDLAMAAEARECAAAMRKWREGNKFKWRNAPASPVAGPDAATVEFQRELVKRLRVIASAVCHHWDDLPIAVRDAANASANAADIIERLTAASRITRREFQLDGVLPAFPTSPITDTDRMVKMGNAIIRAQAAFKDAGNNQYDRGWRDCADQIAHNAGIDAATGEETRP